MKGGSPYAAERRGTAGKTSAASIRRRDREAEGEDGPGRVEHAQPREGVAGVHRGLQVRNREEFFEGREEIVAFLRRKWARELDYRLEKNLWCFTGNRIAVRFEYESNDAEGQWWRSHGNELWEFDESGLMRRRDASINDYEIEESERKFRWSR